MSQPFRGKPIVINFENHVDAAKSIASEAGVSVDADFDSSEIQYLNETFASQFNFIFKERDFIVAFEDFATHITLGAEVAKKQMSAKIGGEQPQSGQIAGPLLGRAAWFGVGDDWDDISSITNGSSTFTTGSLQNWIHAGTTLLGGTAGNDIKILENAVHVVLGVMDTHPSPKIETFEFRINNATYPTVTVGNLWKFSDVRIKFLQRPFVLREDYTFRARFFIPNTGSSSVVDHPQLLTASFVYSDVLQKGDPSDIPGTTLKVVTTA